ncbi:MAG: phytoene/squalene synthase family protein [Candidatus Roizmanbacteria bacterium]
MENPNYAEITKKASRTFYLSTLLFPKKLRGDVFVLYSYLRMMDDMIDSVPSEYLTYEQYKALTLAALHGKPSGIQLIDGFALLVEKKNIPETWVHSFYSSLELDYKSKTYADFTDLEEFVYGVAEVVGLMMAKVMGLPDTSHPTAQALGKSMQLINILRDIDEDARLGRTYLPQDELARFSISHLPPTNPTEESHFIDFIRFQFQRINEIHAEAESGFESIPVSSRVAIQTASDVYYSIGKTIADDPLIVFKQKVRPSLLRILMYALQNYIRVQWAKYHQSRPALLNSK